MHCVVVHRIGFAVSLVFPVVVAPTFAEPPTNDRCDNAIPLTAGEYVFDTQHADTDGPSHQLPFCAYTANHTVSGDIWYSLSSPTDQIVDLSLCGACDFDTIILMYPNCECPSGAPNSGTCDDDGCGSESLGRGDSRLVFRAYAGSCRLIQIGGLDGASGQGVLSVSIYDSPTNDRCESAIPISEGEYTVRTEPGRFEGPRPLDGCFADVLTLWPDVWYDYVAPANGLVTVSFCDDDGYETRLDVFQGCDCPPTIEQLVGCAATGCGGDMFGTSATMTFRVETGQCYKMRAARGSYLPDYLSTAILRVGPVETGINCPPGLVLLWDPFIFAAVDARQPHPIDNANEPQTIQSLLIHAPIGADPECWTLCEEGPPAPPNSIVNVEQMITDYVVTLSRPAPPAALTEIRYGEVVGDVQSVDIITLPGDVNNDLVADERDIAALIDCLNGINSEAACPSGTYSSDIDRSGATTPADVLRLIDLLNGAGEFEPWLGRTAPWYCWGSP